METHKSTGRSQRTEENNIDRTISGSRDSQKAISVQPRRRSARLIAISKPSAKSQNDEEKPMHDDGEVDENLEEKMDESPPSCGLKEDSANAASVMQNGDAENNPNPMGQKTDDFRRENPKRYRNMQTALSKRRKNAISLPKMNELHTDDVRQPSSSGTTFLFSSPSTPSFSNDTFHSPNDIYPSSSTDQHLFFQRPRPNTDILNKEDAKPMLSYSSDDVGEDEWESVAHPADGDKQQRREGDSVQVHLEGEAAEKFKNEMNPLRAKSEKEAQERAKWEHWMRLEVERKRKELQEDLHRIHFLAHIAHLRFLVSSLTKNRAQLLNNLNSLLDGPSSTAVPMTPTQMQKLLAEVFRPKFRSQEDIFTPPRRWCHNESSVLAHLLSLIQQRGFNTDREIALLFFAYCAFLLELPTRICLAFNPMARLLKIPKYLGFEKAKGRKSAIKTEASSKNKKKTTPTNKKQRLAQKAGKEEEEQEESDVNSSANSSANSPSDEEEDEEEREIAKRRRRKRRTATTTKATTQNSSNNRTRKKKSSKVGNGIKEEEKEEQQGKKDAKKQEKHLDIGNDEKGQQNHSSSSRAYWNEYWDELEQRWICVDAFFSQFDAPERIEQRAGFKFLYVLAIDNEMGVREVAAKYSSTFLALETRKLRTDTEWIGHTMEYPILRANEPRVRLENSAILQLLKSKPLPAKMNEFKNHPLYALQKDLLKFEAIYPADTAPVGRIRNHDIYPRSAVHKLEGSLNWIKESRSIKEGELPYKVVGARPKMNIPKEKRQPLTLDLFGFWQTEPYKPPRVEDGRIPRNQFGNIYMYKAEMLPQDCVHLRLPGVFQLARRFDLEAVPAVVGWEYSGGLNHPILDGCVVLQKDEQVLRSAWQEMSQNKAANQAKKSEERVLKNWRRLIRGKRLLEQMRERFK